MATQTPTATATATPVKAPAKKSAPSAPATAKPAATPALTQAVVTPTSTDTASATAAVTKTMPLMPKVKLHVEGPGKTITVAEYLAAKVKEFPLVDETVVKALANKVKDGQSGSYTPPAMKQKAADQFVALRKQMKADFAASIKNKADWDATEARRIAEEKAAKEKAEAAHKAELEANEAALSKALEAPKVVKTLQLTEKALDGLSVLSSKIRRDETTGEIVVAEGATKADFQEAFAVVIAANSASASMQDRSAKAEAELAYVTKQHLGDGWKDLFSGRPEDESRIAKGIKIFSTVKAIGPDALKVFNKVPLSTARALLEMRVTTAADEESPAVAEAKNLEAKKKVLAKAAEKLEESGNITQIEAKNIVSDFKKSLGIAAKETFKYFHIMDDANDDMKIFGSLPTGKRGDPDEAIVRDAMLTVDTNGNRYVWQSKGKVICVPIGGPVEWMLNRIRNSRKVLDAMNEDGTPKDAETLAKEAAIAAKKAAAAGENATPAAGANTTGKKKGAAIGTVAATAGIAPVPNPEDDDEDGIVATIPDDEDGDEGDEGGNQDGIEDNLELEGEEVDTVLADEDTEEDSEDEDEDGDATIPSDEDGGEEGDTVDVDDDSDDDDVEGGVAATILPDDDDE